MFSFLSLRGKGILREAIPELCVPINLLQVGSVHSFLHPHQRAQRMSVPMATLPWRERGRKRGADLFKRQFCFMVLPFLQLGWMVFLLFLSLISLAIDCSLPVGIIGFKSFIFWFLNCSSPGSLLLLEVRFKSH